MKEQDQLESKILVDQVRSFDDSLTIGRIGSSSVCLLAAWIFRDSVNHTQIFAWLVTQILFNIVSPYYWFKPGRDKANASNAKWRLRALSISSLISGLLWMGGVVLMWAPGNFESQLMVIFIAFGMASVSLHALNAHLPAFYCFFIPCISSIPLISLWQRDSFSMIVIFAFSFFLTLNTLLAIRMHHSLINSIRKHYIAVELAEELQQQKEIAEAAGQVKSRFLAAASHDLRQPMHALNLYLGGLTLADLSPQAYAILENARVCADSLDNMFSALLDISQLDASIVEAKLSHVPVNLIFNKIKVEFASQALEKGLNLRVAPCSAYVRADSHLLENILRNLVSNALRYTHTGKVLLGCRRCPEGLRISVYDTGVGIAAEEQNKIFEEYYQVGNPRRDHSRGLGLGLAIVQRQAHIMNTSIIVSSEPGRGSIFSITLPLSLSQEIQAAAANIQPDCYAGALQGCFVIIIDDNALILNATSQLLVQWGCIVQAASSSADMLDKLAKTEHIPDLIICDDDLHEAVTGMDVIHSLRQEFNHNIPALLITGDTSPDKVRRLIAAGLPVLHKPLQDHVLHAALIKLLQSH